MPFETENGLRKAAIQPILEEFSSSTKTEYLEEVDYGGGRTDLVVGRISKPYLRHRISNLNLGIPILKSSYLKVFLLLQNRKEITREYLSQLCNKKGLSQSAIDWLEEKGFFCNSSPGKLKTRPNLRKHTTTSYAIEFKLTDWKTALRQAYRAKSYTNYQFVVLDDSYVHRAENRLEKFSKFNIGIASVSTGGDLDIVHKPEKEKPFNPTMNWRLNEQLLANR